MSRWEEYGIYLAKVRKYLKNDRISEGITAKMEPETDLSVVQFYEPIFSLTFSFNALRGIVIKSHMMNKIFLSETLSRQKVLFLFM